MKWWGASDVESTGSSYQCTSLLVQATSLQVYWIELRVYTSTGFLALMKNIVQCLELARRRPVSSFARTPHPCANTDHTRDSITTPQPNTPQQCTAQHNTPHPRQGLGIPPIARVPEPEPYVEIREPFLPRSCSRPLVGCFVPSSKGGRKQPISDHLSGAAACCCRFLLTCTVPVPIPTSHFAGTRSANT